MPWRPTTFERMFRKWKIIVWEADGLNGQTFWLFALRKYGMQPRVYPRALMRQYKTAKAARIAAINCIKTANIKPEKPLPWRPRGQI